MDLVQRQLDSLKLKVEKLKRVKTTYQRFREVFDLNVRHQYVLTRENRVMKRALENVAASKANQELSDYAKIVLRGLGFPVAG